MDLLWAGEAEMSFAPVLSHIWVCVLPSLVTCSSSSPALSPPPEPLTLLMGNTNTKLQP